MRRVGAVIRAALYFAAAGQGGGDLVSPPRLHSWNSSKRGPSIRTKAIRPAESVVLAAGYAVMPSAAVVADKSVVPLLLVCVMVSALTAWRGGWRPARPDALVWGLLAGLLGWGLVASLWSFDAGANAWRAVRVLSLVASGWLLLDLTRHAQARAPRLLEAAIAAGVVAGLAVFAVEVFFDHPLYRLVRWEGFETEVRTHVLNRGGTTLAILVWPAAALIAGRFGPAPAVVLVAAVGGALLLGVSHAAMAAFSAAVLFFLAARLHRLAAPVLLALALVFSIAATPWIAQGFYAAGLHEAQELPRTWQHRVHIWAFSAERSFEKPVAGWGFNSAQDMPNFHWEEFRGRDRAVIPSHTHNAGLQLWMDLGIVGVGLFLAFAGAALRRLRHLAGPSRRAAQTTVLAVLVVAGVAYGLWQTQWVATVLWSAGTLTVLACRTEAESRRTCGGPPLHGGGEGPG